MRKIRFVDDDELPKSKKNTKKYPGFFDWIGHNVFFWGALIVFALYNLWGSWIDFVKYPVQILIEVILTSFIYAGIIFFIGYWIFRKPINKRGKIKDE